MDELLHRLTRDHLTVKEVTIANKDIDQYCIEFKEVRHHCQTADRFTVTGKSPAPFNVLLIITPYIQPECYYNYNHPSSMRGPPRYNFLIV